MGHEDRAKILIRMADLLDERAEDFAVREAMDMGMPYADFRAIIMPHCSGLFRFFAGQAMAHMDGGYRTFYEPDIRILMRSQAAWSGTPPTRCRPPRTRWWWASTPRRASRSPRPAPG